MVEAAAEYQPLPAWQALVPGQHDGFPLLLKGGNDTLAEGGERLYRAIATSPARGALLAMTG